MAAPRLTPALAAPAPLTPAQVRQKLARNRAGFALAAIVAPLLLMLLFERQARRLDALADHGAPVTARVDKITRDDTLHYSYQVAGVRHSWNVHHRDAPHATGQEFAAVYLPEDPSLSRPFAERRLAAAEAASVRSFGRWTALVAAWFMGVFAVFAHRLIRNLNAEPPRQSTQGAHLRFLGVALSPIPVVMFAGHVRDALAHGESLGGVAFAFAVTAVALVAIYRLSLRPQGDPRRARMLKSGIAVLAIAIGLARLAMLLFDS